RFGEGNRHCDRCDRALEGAGGRAGAEVREERGRAKIGRTSALRLSVLCSLGADMRPSVIYSVDTRKHFLFAHSNFCPSIECRGRVDAERERTLSRSPTGYPQAVWALIGRIRPARDTEHSQREANDLASLRWKSDRFDR